MQPRKSIISLIYNGVDTKRQVSNDLASFGYTDVASGSSDSVRLTLNDRDRKWIGAWFPQKGDRLQPTIITENWNREDEHFTFSCGTFCVDDFSFYGGPPRQLELEGVALPADTGFKATKRTQTYQQSNLREIGETVAERSGLDFHYEASTVSIASVEQKDQTDCEFYNALVEKYGLSLKIYHDRLVVFSEAAYEEKPVKATLTEADFEPGWEWNTTLSGTYTGVNYEYENPETDKTISLQFGGGERIYTCTEAADNITEATLIALAAVNNANKDTTTMELTLSHAVPGLIASDCVQLQGLGNLSGKYYVKEISHEIGNSGYRMTLKLRLAGTRIGVGGPESDAQTDASELVKGRQYTLTETKKGYYTAAEALAGQVRDGHPSGVCRPGTYYIYNIAQGMLNLSDRPDVPGSWINPN